jgi:hypothetical protein
MQKPQNLLETLVARLAKLGKSTPLDLNYVTHYMKDAIKINGLILKKHVSIPFATLDIEVIKKGVAFI